MIDLFLSALSKEYPNQAQRYGVYPSRCVDNTVLIIELLFVNSKPHTRQTNAKIIKAKIMHISLFCLINSNFPSFILAVILLKPRANNFIQGYISANNEIYVQLRDKNEPVNMYISKNGMITFFVRLYDTTPYGYHVGDTRVFKIITKGDTDYENAFYCINAKENKVYEYRYFYLVS